MEQVHPGVNGEARRSARRRGSCCLILVCVCMCMGCGCGCIVVCGVWWLVCTSCSAELFFSAWCCGCGEAGVPRVPRAVCACACACASWAAAKWRVGRRGEAGERRGAGGPPALLNVHCALCARMAHLAME